MEGITPREKIIRNYKKKGYSFTFECPKCNIIYDFCVERTSFSGFTTNDYYNSIYSCCSCDTPDICINCYKKEHTEISLNCKDCKNCEDSE